MATDPDRPNSGPRTAKLALLVPLAVLGAMVLFIGLIATLFLYTTKTGALVLAAVAAGGILFSISMLASQDRLEPAQRFTAVGAGVLPILVGGLIAAGVIGGVAEEDRNINVQPLEIVPEDAPVIAAEDSNDFCLPDESGGCNVIDEWEFVPSAEVDTIAYLFDNREAGVPHNVVITELDGTADDPAPGAEITASDVVDGPDEDFHLSDVPVEDLPEEFYFFCAVHPNMDGLGILSAEGGDPGA